MPDTTENPRPSGNTGGNLLFLISQPRTGSTLVQRILGGHSKIHTASEPWIMLHPLYALKKHGIKGEFSTHLAETALRDLLSRVPEKEELFYNAVRNYANTFYEKMLAETQKTIFLDKTPRYYNIVPELVRVFPEAKFIFVLRHPLAVLSSVLKTWFNNDPGELARNSHLRDVLKGPGLLVEGMEHLGSAATLVRYEELVDDPERLARVLCRSIGVEYEPNLTNYGSGPSPDWIFGDPVEVAKHQSPEQNIGNSWLRNLSSPALINYSLEYLDKIGEVTINKLGYSYDEMKTRLKESAHNFHD